MQLTERVSYYRETVAQQHHHIQSYYASDDYTEFEPLLPGLTALT